MRIRSATPDADAAACARIYAPFVTGSAVSFDETPPDAPTFAAKIATLSASYPFLVAESGGGEIVGFAYAGPYRERAAYRWSCESSVYVHEQHRHAGIGRVLYAQLFAQLRTQGFRTVIAGITQPNRASMALHTSFGFEPVGTFRRIGYKHGAWRDVAFLALTLSGEDGGDEPPREPGPPAQLAAGLEAGDLPPGSN